MLAQESDVDPARVPEGTELGIHTAGDLLRIATEVNERPRKTLGWQRPDAFFGAEMATATA